MSAIVMMTLLTGNVVEIHDENWVDHAFDSGKVGFVKFYAPWCGHCKKLAPDWEKLGSLFAADDTRYVGKVDCTTNSLLCKQKAVTGYPTLLTMWKNRTEAYRGDRTLEALRQHVEAMHPFCNTVTMEHCTADEAIAIREVLSTSTDHAQQRRAIEAAVDARKAEHEALIASLRKSFEESNEALDAFTKSAEFNVSVLEEHMAAAAPAPKDEV